MLVFRVDVVKWFGYSCLAYAAEFESSEYCEGKIIVKNEYFLNMENFCLMLTVVSVSSFENGCELMFGIKICAS